MKLHVLMRERDPPPSIIKLHVLTTRVLPQFLKVGIRVLLRTMESGGEKATSRLEALLATGSVFFEPSGFPPARPWELLPMAEGGGEDFTPCGDRGASLTDLSFYCSEQPLPPSLGAGGLPPRLSKLSPSLLPPRAAASPRLLGASKLALRAAPSAPRGWRLAARCPPSCFVLFASSLPAPL